jgi:hypothetical protein
LRASRGYSPSLQTQRLDQRREAAWWFVLPTTGYLAGEVFATCNKRTSIGRSRRSATSLLPGNLSIRDRREAGQSNKYEVELTWRDRRVPA